jgi:NADH:ubiquinone oxidoreductase subunit E
VVEKRTSQLAELIEPYAGRSEELIQVLREVQEKLGYLSKEVQEKVAQTLGVPLSRVYGVITFYHFFRTSPAGQHTIRLCLGTACYVRGAAQVLQTLQEELGINPGETTDDYKFSLERVACFGCCALSPVMVVDNTVHSRMTPAKAREILSTYQGS